MTLMSHSGPVPAAIVNSPGGDTSPGQSDATKGSYLDRRENRPSPYSKTKPGSHKGAKSPTPEKPLEGSSSLTNILADDLEGGPSSEIKPIDDDNIELDEGLLDSSRHSDGLNTS